MAETLATRKPIAKRGKTKQEKRFIRLGLLFTLPWIIGFLLFQIYPICSAIYYSLTDYNVFQAPNFIGLKNYTDLFNLMMSLVGYPDLLIYLKSTIPNLISQIQKRGRDYEKSIRIDYLTGLNEKYEAWISSYKGKLLVIDADNVKFGDRPEDFEKVTDMIDAQLYGLFKD